MNSARRWWPVAALAALLSVPGCTSSSPPAGTSPIEITESSLSGEVTLEATASSTDSSVTVNYTISNTSQKQVWMVHSGAAHVIPDNLSEDGVALAMAFFPPRRDVSYAQPPYEPVISVDPAQSLKGSVTVERPFKPFADLEGNRAVALPNKPRSVRLCIGYVRAEDLPPNQPGPLSEGKKKIDRGIAFPAQSLACSAAMSLS